MANVTNLQVITFCDEQVRPFADLRVKEYYAAKVLVNNWFASGVSALVPNDTSVIEDSASAAPGPDGRTPITGAAVTNMVTRAQDIITDLEANTSAKLNTLLAVYVNGATPF